MSQDIVLNKQDLEIIKAAVDRKNILLHGPGGVGKSTIIKMIKDTLSSMNINCVVCAMTGAASLQVSGRTLHSHTGIGLGQDSEVKLLQKVRASSGARKRWIETDVLIVDEVSMLGNSLLTKLDFIARSIRKNNKPMGNTSIIFSGDFLQLHCINDTYCFTAKVWSELNLQVYNLTESRRYDNKDFFDMLLRIRLCTFTKDDIKRLQGCKDKYDKMMSEKEGSDILSIKPTILYSKRVDVDVYNKKELDKLGTQEYVYEASDLFLSKNDKDVSEVQKDYYDGILEQAIPRTIILKIGAQVILRKNLDVDVGLINGSRGIVISVHTESQIVTVKFINGLTVPISKNTWECELEDSIAIRDQIPLILGWSITIHRIQGSTLDCCICDLSKNIFAYSQAYVALSRCRNIDGLYLSSFDSSSIKADPIALKFVKSLEKEQNNKNINNINNNNHQSEEYNDNQSDQSDSNEEYISNS